MSSQNPFFETLARPAVRCAVVVLQICLAVGVCSTAGADTVRIVADKASVHLKPIEASAIMAAVPVGAVLEMTGQEGDWYRVTLPPDSSGFRREGYVNRRHAETDRATPAVTADPAASRSPAPAAASPRADLPERRAGGQRPTMAVLPFDHTMIRRWWSGTWDVGAGIADLIIDQLTNSDEFRVLERKQLESVLVEQELANSDRADISAAKAARLSKLLGARYLLKGSVTQFTAENSTINSGGRSISGLGGLSLRTSTATVALTVRLIDSSTAEIVASASKEEHSQKRSVALRGSTMMYGGGVSLTSSNFLATQLGDATRKAVEGVITDLVARMRRRSD